MGVARRTGHGPEQQCSEWALPPAARRLLSRIRPSGLDRGDLQSHLAQIPGRTPLPDESVGLNYDEVHRSDLVKVDVNGENVDPGPLPRQSGRVCQSTARSHASRGDAPCLIHTHTTPHGGRVQGDGAQSRQLLRALLHGPVAYHDSRASRCARTRRVRLVATWGTRT